MLPESNGQEVIETEATNAPVPGTDRLKLPTDNLELVIAAIKSTVRDGGSALSVVRRLIAYFSQE